MLICVCMQPVYHHPRSSSHTIPTGATVLPWMYSRSASETLLSWEGRLSALLCHSRNHPTPRDPKMKNTEGQPRSWTMWGDRDSPAMEPACKHDSQINGPACLKDWPLFTTSICLLARGNLW